MKKILFMSAIDFKEKSIQVIRKTPEAYAAHGWLVHYIVARDNCNSGNYYYEKIVNVNGINVERFFWPLEKLRGRARSRIIRLALTKISSIIVTFELARRGARILRSERPDVIYGYEINGVLATTLLRWFGKLHGVKTISRFQGTWLFEILQKRQLLRFIWNLDAVIALRARCDLAIMTNDGTRGDLAMHWLRSPARKNLRLWVNGVDLPPTIKSKEEFRSSLGLDKSRTILLSASRLERWKRVDRGIEIAKELKKIGLEFSYFIIGGGAEYDRLRKLVESYNLSDCIFFTGPINNEEVFDYMNSADVFISMYELSNVGNPLLEAIKMNKVILTLNNGDTGSWIEHKKNGLIYSEDDQDLFVKAAKDLVYVLSNYEVKEFISREVEKLSRRIWSWEERLRTEIAEVDKIIGES